VKYLESVSCNSPLLSVTLFLLLSHLFYLLYFILAGFNHGEYLLYAKQPPLSACCMHRSFLCLLFSIASSIALLVLKPPPQVAYAAEANEKYSV